MLKIHDNVVFSNDDVGFDYIGSDIVTLFSDDMNINVIDLNNSNLDGDDDYLETMIHARLAAWCNEYKQCKAFKKELSKELMLARWHSTRWWGWCVLKDEKNKN